MADDLTRMDPQIARLAEYYRHPTEERPGEGFLKRLARITLTAMSSSKEDYQRAQQAKERLFMANAELNRIKEVQKLARQQLELSTAEAQDRMKSAEQKRQLAGESAKRLREIYGYLTPTEKKAAIGGVPLWSTELGRRVQESEIARNKAYTDYLKSGKGSDTLEASRLLGILNSLQSGARARTKGSEQMLDAQAKQIASTEFADPTAIGQYAANAFGSMEQYLVDAQDVDLMGRPTPSTVQSGKIPQHYQRALGAVQGLAQQMKIDVPNWRDTDFSSALRKKLEAIQAEFKPGTSDFTAAYKMAIIELVSRLTGDEADQFIRGVGGPEMATMILSEAFSPAVPKSPETEEAPE